MLFTPIEQQLACLLFLIWDQPAIWFQDILAPPKCPVPLIRSGSSAAMLPVVWTYLWIAFWELCITNKNWWHRIGLLFICQFSVLITARIMVVVTLPLAVPWGEWGEGSSCLSHNRFILICSKDNRSHDPMLLTHLVFFSASPLLCVQCRGSNLSAFSCVVTVHCNTDTVKEVAMIWMI